jgi:hypothetical protein
LRRTTALIFTLFLTSAALTDTVRAQKRRTASAGRSGDGPTYGATGTLALPMGDLGDGLGPGLGAGAFAEVEPAGLPVAFRFDGQFAYFTGKKGRNSGNVLQATANAVFDFPSSSGGGKSPAFALGGIGLYRASGGGDSETNFGFNLGGGYNFRDAGYKPFLDGRVHFVDGNQYFAVSIGFRF